MVRSRFKGNLTRGVTVKASPSLIKSSVWAKNYLNNNTVFWATAKCEDYRLKEVEAAIQQEDVSCQRKCKAHAKCASQLHTSEVRLCVKENQRASISACFSKSVPNIGRMPALLLCGVNVDVDWRHAQLDPAILVSYVLNESWIAKVKYQPTSVSYALATYLSAWGITVGVNGCHQFKDHTSDMGLTFKMDAL